VFGLCEATDDQTATVGRYALDFEVVELALSTVTAVEYRGPPGGNTCDFS
jgi:hypothetical protein